MLAVHGFWSHRGGLCVWGEDSSRNVKSRSQAMRSARPHPFAVPAHELSNIFGGVEDTAIVALPSLLTAPLDSLELVRLRPRPTPTRMPVLSSWSVPVVVLDAAAALNAHGRHSDDPVDSYYPTDNDWTNSEWADNEWADDIRYGASLRFLAGVSEFARSLAERGRMLPTLEHRDDGGAAARWRPVLQGPDVTAFHALIAAMPPVFRCEVDTPNDLTGQNPTDLTTAALRALSDAAVREHIDVSQGSTPSGGMSVADMWFDALRGLDATFDADADEIDVLAGMLSAWDDFADGRVGPARATFWLTEAGDAPPADSTASAETSPVDSPVDPAAAHSSQWRLEFCLQSIEDPSLLVAAPHVWTGGQGLQRWIERPDQLLLTELGRASMVYPALAGALRAPRPEALDLDSTGAHDFLANYADVLDQAGFGVLLPSWWNNQRKLGLTASASTSPDGGVSEGMFTAEALCAFEWQLAVGDEPLTADELAALAATKEPLVRLRGEWIAVDPEQIRRGLEFIDRQAESTVKPVSEIISLAATHSDDTETPLPVTAVHADGWLGDLLSGTAERSLKPIEPPNGFTATLRPYQQRGLSWLAFLSNLKLGACLADDMGLGKTIQLLALELHLRASQPDSGPTLLLCPMSLIGNWQREAAKFAPSLRVYAHHGPDRLRDEDLTERLAAVDLVVTTYHTASRDIDDLAEHTWERVALDEAQAIKNHRTKFAQAARRLEATSRVALTGTPMENRLAELWSVMDFLNPGILGSAELFRTRYANPIGRYGQTEPVDRLRAVTQPYILRRVKTDTSIVDDLPEKIEIKQYCNLTTEQASLYQSIVAEMLPKIEQSEGIERRGNVLAAMTKLKQVCNHPRQLLHDGSAVGRRSGKVIRLHEILEEILAQNDRVLLFTQFTEFADMLMPHLSTRFGRDVIYLHGKTSKTHRDEMVQRFQDDSDGPPIFLLSLKAGGTGLNLTAANHVVHLDRWWNPAVENQATDRAFRIGQKRSVQVRKFICTGTLEEKIDQMIEQKKELADLVVGDGEGWLTDLSTQDLRHLFTLSQGAVGE